MITQTDKHILLMKRVVANPNTSSRNKILAKEILDDMLEHRDRDIAIEKDLEELHE